MPGSGFPMHSRDGASQLQPQSLPVPAAVDSVALFGSRNEVLIVHGSETYRLRRTRQGKLILTK